MDKLSLHMMQGHFANEETWGNFMYWNIYMKKVHGIGKTHLLQQLIMMLACTSRWIAKASDHVDMFEPTNIGY